MPEWIRIGQRKNDYAFMVDFHLHRAIVRANTTFIHGYELEEIAPGFSGFKPAMVLVHRDWHELYFVNERQDWTEDFYFEFAEKRFKELGIAVP